MNTNEWETGQITLNLNGTPIVLNLTIPLFPVTADVMLPIFQQMANSFVDLGIKAAESESQKISCKKGCGACCCQPVPLAEIEVYYINRFVNRLPEPLQTEIKKRFEEGAAHFEKMGWFEKLANCKEEEALQETVLEYFFQGIPCPFLEEGSCSIYEYRPIACREYLVTSPAENCSHPIASGLNQLKLLIKVSEGTRQLSRGASLPKLNFNPFIKVLRLAKEYPENSIEKTGAEWLSDFFG